MNDQANARLGGNRRWSSTLVGAAVAVAVVAGLVVGSGSAAAIGEGSQTTLSCEPITEGILSGFVYCSYVSDRELGAGEGVQFTADVGGATQTVTATGETTAFNSANTCGNAEGFCYHFLFVPEQPGASVSVSSIEAVVSRNVEPGAGSQEAEQPSTESADDEASTDSTEEADPELYPCEGDPSYMCRAAAPTGDGVVYIHNDGETVTIDPGNNGVDETDQQYDYDASTPPSTREEVEAREEVYEAVEDIPEDQMPVITAANGLQSTAQQENAISLEQQLWDRGEPYMVCFEPVTLTVRGEQVTYETDCVVITPN
ncbi:MAG: hypothetical protein F4197_04675 [Acidimicrobiia bacterium]|nr:hypothetical protein [Acidimicrobiia bacterium]